MAIKTANVTVTTSATPLLSSADADLDPGQGVSLYVATGTVYVGGADVTADTAAGTGGRPIVGPDTFDFDLASGNDVPYARTASGSVVVHVFRTGA